MALLPIRTYPDEVLTRKAESVGQVDDELRTLLDDMAETMYAGNGVGLAAPQVGVSKRILVMDCGDPEEPEGAQLLAFVDPEIVDSEGRIVWEEGCLSFPGLTAEVERAEQVTVRALGYDGAPFEMRASGLPAVCLQHEMDHLDGLTILDRLSPLRRQRALLRWRRLRAELEAEAEAEATAP